MKNFDKLFKSTALQVGVILFLINLLLEFFKNKIANPVDSDMNYDVVKPVSNPTITKQEALLKANRLHSFMYSFGTNEKGIYQVFEGLNKSDYNLIHNEFGYKPYESLLGTHADIYGSKKDLTFWLFNELTDNQIKPLINQFSIRL